MLNVSTVARFIMLGVLLVVFAAACTARDSEVTATATRSTTVTAAGTSAAEAEVVTTVPGHPPEIQLVDAGSGFQSPVLLIADPSGGADLVVEQSGRVVRNDDGHTVTLDISGDVLFGGEQGLLGLAFHPQSDANQLAYVNYVNRSGSTVVEEFKVVDGVFDVSTRRIVLEVEQPAANHNGGMVAFGPDGYLWIGMGDGGGANDRFGQGQDPQTLLGSMLRIDVDERTAGDYGIPDDNPFVDGIGGAPEVWAVGVRNPWRFSFDGSDLWIADVGQNEVEEVDRVDTIRGGLNFGWPVMEGTDCFQAETCDAEPYVEPVDEYRHDEGCSITGGYVYRGSAIPGLDGHYFFSDFCTGFIRSYTDGTGEVDWTPMTGAVAKVSGFGVGGDGELYVVSLGGTVFRVEQG
jgi:glucose/arabinose dehydrogenase